MDPVDLRLLATLAEAGRTTFADLAEQVGLSSPSTAERVRRLEDRGVIRGYHADINPAELGRDITAFIAVSLRSPDDREEFLSRISARAGIVECHHVAGDDDYLLKCHTSSTRGLEELLSEEIKSIPGVIRTRTTIVLSTPLQRPFGAPTG